MRPCNDNVTPIFDWLYLGGVKNIRKTLPFIDVWYDFRIDISEPKNLIIPSHVIRHHLPFSDGELSEALPIWSESFQEIMDLKKQNKKIFISCYEGVSRSAVLALWICCELLGEFDAALKHIKSCRNIFPDKNFNPFINSLKMKYQTQNKY